MESELLQNIPRPPGKRQHDQMQQAIQAMSLLLAALKVIESIKHLLV